MNTDEMLAARTKTHGDFTVNSVISQALKSVVRSFSDWSKLSADKQEAIDMIFHKIGRILAGDPDYRDHWDDISGYSIQASRRCKTKDPGFGGVGQDQKPDRNWMDVEKLP